MARHPRHINLYEGPLDSDGQQTWFCVGRDIPRNFERKKTADQTWSAPMRSGGPAQAENNDNFFMVRERVMADPIGHHVVDHGEDVIITSTWTMYDRADTDQWEIHLPREQGGDWVPLDKAKHLGPQSTFHGVTVRRRKNR